MKEINGNKSRETVFFEEARPSEWGRTSDLEKLSPLLRLCSRPIPPLWEETLELLSFPCCRTWPGIMLWEWSPPSSSSFFSPGIVTAVVVAEAPVQQA